MPTESNFEITYPTDNSSVVEVITTMRDFARALNTNDPLHYCYLFTDFMNSFLSSSVLPSSLEAYGTAELKLLLIEFEYFSKVCNDFDKTDEVIHRIMNQIMSLEYQQMTGLI